MRVIECDHCGETISAANDEELIVRVGRHLSGEHDQKLDGDELEELIGEEAYDALDS